MVYGFSFSARALFGDNRSFAFFGAAASVAALFDFWRQVVEKIGIIKEIRTRLGFGNKVELVVTEDGLLIKSDEYRLVKLKEEVRL